MHFRMRAGTAFACVAACLAAGLCAAPPFQQLHRVFATSEDGDRLLAVRDNYPAAFDDGIIVSTFVNTEIGSPKVKKFQEHASFTARFREAGIPVQLCMSTTIGHNDQWTLTNDLPKMVGSDGHVAKAMCCPRSPAFHASMRALFRKYAELKPSVIWFDDDFRMESHGEADMACFCPSCVARFNRETGLALDRPAVVAAILSDETVSGVRVRRAWREYSSRALTELVATAAEAVHAVDASIALGIMAVNIQGRGYAPPDFPAWIEKARNCDGVVYFRHGSGVYTDYTPYASDGLVMKNISIARMCAATEGPGVVNLTESVTYPYSRRTKSMRMTFLEGVLSIGMAGADGITYDSIKPNLDEQLRPNAVVAEMSRRDGEMQRLASLVRGKRQKGVYPFWSPDLWLANGPVKRLAAMEPLVRGAEVWRYLVYVGVPFTFREQDASLLLFARHTPRAMEKETLEKWLARGVLADQTAVEEMARVLGRPVEKGPHMSIYPKPFWDQGVWARAPSLWIKDELDRLAGGRFLSRVETEVRLAQSVWESPDGKERVIFLFNLDFDDAVNVQLIQDGSFTAESLNAADGTWTKLGTGDTFTVPCVPAWSPLAIRLTR